MKIDELQLQIGNRAIVTAHEAPPTRKVSIVFGAIPSAEIMDYLRRWEDLGAEKALYGLGDKRVSYHLEKVAVTTDEVATAIVQDLQELGLDVLRINR
jgi:hypothetical protein